MSSLYSGSFRILVVFNHFKHVKAIDAPFVVNKLLSKALAFIAKNAEETINFNNVCIQSLKEAIMSGNRKNLLVIKAGLIGFTVRENEREFKNMLLGLYLELIEQQLRNKPI